MTTARTPGGCPMTFVYLDTETTGLDPDRHEVWEIAYAIDDGPVLSAFVPHSLATADREALELNGYWRRHVGRVDDRADLHARLALDGATLVGANPAFDAAFLRARWGVTPWKYRLLDVEAYAMGALGFDEPRGLAAIREALVELGRDIPEPDHTAGGDVATVRACHLALRSIYATTQARTEQEPCS